MSSRHKRDGSRAHGELLRRQAATEAAAGNRLREVAARYGGALPMFEGGRLLRDLARETGVEQEHLQELAVALGVWRYEPEQIRVALNERRDYGEAVG